MLINEDNYVDMAENAILELIKDSKDKKGKPILIVTTSKIRNLLAMVSDIYNEVLKISGNKLGNINYMKIRFYYEAGREVNVKKLLETAKVFKIIGQIEDSKENYILFSRYMEALIAFRKFHGGKDE